MRKYIINDILDWYEKKKAPPYHYPMKRIKEYLHPSKCNSVIQVIKDLENLQIVQSNKDKNGYIKTLTLLDVGSLYQLIGRTSQKEKNQKLYKIIKKYKNTGKTNYNFCCFLEEKIENKKTSKYFKYPLSIIMEYISILENNKKLIYQDTFSGLIPECTTHSFKEHYKTKVLHIMRTFGNYQGTDNEILKECHVIQKEHYIKMKGNGTIYFHDCKVPVVSMALSSEEIEKIEKIECQNFISVENETVYDGMEVPNSFILFSSGFPGKDEIELMKKIKAKSYFHTGDIDAGGFLIFENIKKETGLPFSPLKMDLQTLKNFQSFSITLTENDKKRLKTIKNFPEVTSYMLEHNIKLEQEYIWQTDTLH